METGGGPTDGKRKGMTPISNSSPIQFSLEYDSLHYDKMRSEKSAHKLGSIQEVESLRNLSVSTALSKLQIDDSCRNEPQRPSRISKLTATGSVRVPKAPARAAMRKSRVDNTSGTFVLFQPAESSLVTPSTPSQIPILSRAVAARATPATPSRVPKSSTTKTPFLTKNSNITNFTAWDVRGRLEDMEAMYTELKDTLTGTSMERNGIEEAVTQFKVRCM